MSSIFIKPSTKAKLSAVVGLKDQAVKAVPASKILSAQITGGVRRLKRFEIALRSVGALPSNYFTVPGDAAKLDSYGNISRGQIIQMLAYFKAFPETGYRANTTEARKTKLARGTRKKYGVSYFVGQPGGGRLPLGIWQRVHTGFGTAIRPILIFVPRALYEPIFDFVADKIVKREFNGEFKRAMFEAVLSAK